MEEETEVIGFKRVTRGTIGMEKGFVILNEVFHPACLAGRQAARAIDGFVDE